MAVLNWSQCPAVEQVPGKVSGAWVLRGTRMPVATIFENLEAGASLDDLMNWYEGLDRKQVQAVIELAAAEAEGFEAFLTTDKNLRYKQNLAGRQIVVVVIQDAQWPRLEPHVANVVAAVGRALPGTFIEVSAVPG